MVWERGSADCLIQESDGQQLEAIWESISAWFQTPVESTWGQKCGEVVGVYCL